MSIKREIIKVYDMTCTSCEYRVEKALKKIDGVVNAMASYSAQQVTVEYDSDLCTRKQLIKQDTVRKVQIVLNLQVF